MKKLCGLSIKNQVMKNFKCTGPAGVISQGGGYLYQNQINTFCRIHCKMGFTTNFQNFIYF